MSVVVPSQTNLEVLPEGIWSTESQILQRCRRVHVYDDTGFGGNIQPSTGLSGTWSFVGTRQPGDNVETRL